MRGQGPLLGNGLFRNNPRPQSWLEVIGDLVIWPTTWANPIRVSSSRLVLRLLGIGHIANEMIELGHFLARGAAN